MKHLKKLTRNEKIATEKEGLESKDFLRLTRNSKDFTIVNIHDDKEIHVINY